MSFPLIRHISNITFLEPLLNYYPRPLDSVDVNILDVSMSSSFLNIEELINVL